ncbi:hypothetical protein ACIQRE_01980 [Streptomyces griseoluteus]|uniref:hypothetical protein n=1 Tax=Streptomyces griseoluteus TaxID=29306 RepID=UPI00380DBC60
MSDDMRQALIEELKRRGRRFFTTEDYSRQGVLDALRENRRRHANEPLLQEVVHAAKHVASEIKGVVDLPAADIATVLLAAGGTIGILAEMHGLSAHALGGVLQYAGDELDQQATGGERP